ncbi:MAG: DUF3053 family protein [Pseudolabrys sp.]
MTAITRRVANVAAVIVLVMGLAACGDSEPDQRKAFIEFLQTRVLDKPGSRVPRLTAEDTGKFGPYAEHYALIPAFNDEMTKAMAGASKITQTAAPSSLQELVNRRDEVKALVAAMSDTAVQTRKTLAETDAKRAALKQPDDLKAVYAKAYERTVTAPAQAFLDTIPLAMDGLLASVQLADYLDTHRTGVKIAGANIQSSDNKTRNEIGQLLAAVKAKNDKLNEARKRLRQVTEGN